MSYIITPPCARCGFEHAEYYPHLHSHLCTDCLILEAHDYQLAAQLQLQAPTCPADHLLEDTEPYLVNPPTTVRPSQLSLHLHDARLGYEHIRVKHTVPGQPVTHHTVCARYLIPTPTPDPYYLSTHHDPMLVDEPDTPYDGFATQQAWLDAFHLNLYEDRHHSPTDRQGKCWKPGRLCTSALHLLDDNTDEPSPR